MRTKTLLLSALLGALGSVSVHAQNVYSLNAVGYINVTLNQGFNIITCPLLCNNTNGVQDNSIGSVLDNSTGTFTGCQVYFYSPTEGYTGDTAKAIGSGHTQTTNINGWSGGGVLQAVPGVGFWFDNETAGPLTATFVGQVPTGPMTNTLGANFNLVGSIVPMSGDIVTNSISAFTNYNIGDAVYTYLPGPGYTEFQSVHTHGSPASYMTNWTAPNLDPTLTFVGEGFWYDNKVGTTVSWVENYSVSQ